MANFSAVPLKKYIHTHRSQKSQDSAVDTPTGYGLAGRGGGVRILVRARFFISLCPEG
jgi:hypothetical protein